MEKCSRERKQQVQRPSGRKLSHSRNASGLECSETVGKWYELRLMKQPEVRLFKISKTAGGFPLGAVGSR